MCALTMNGEYLKINTFILFAIFKDENIFCYIYNVQRNLLNYKIKQNM